MLFDRKAIITIMNQRKHELRNTLNIAVFFDNISNAHKIHFCKYFQVYQFFFNVMSETS